MSDNTLILGGGMTGLAAGIVSGYPVYEAAEATGGICSSYYIKPGAESPTTDPTEFENAYRFEIGGGHWIFGGDPLLLAFIESQVKVKRYERRSSVYFPDSQQFVPYPIQNHLHHLDAEVAARALIEMSQPKPLVTTMAEWNSAHFGASLDELFFKPFHELYTAGLHNRIAPQDGYKSPINYKQVVQGTLGVSDQAVGYNTTFLYPESGLDQLAAKMAAQCDVRMNHRVEFIHVKRREVVFDTGERVPYSRLISTLPLNEMLAMSGVSTKAEADPHNSVLVLNIGAIKGHRCPDDHWLYIPNSDNGFHRVGFYSNVDDSFLPANTDDHKQRVSIYIERAYLDKPSEAEIASYSNEVVRELQRWGFIAEAEVVHPTWIDVAYTWSQPGSTWVNEAMESLRTHGIYQIGRYARWHFQGIADSIRDGFTAGASLCPPKD